MKKVTITIETRNAVFADEPGYEVARILRNLADELEEGHRPEIMRDINGNTVGFIVYD